jgi:hypothetical protein
VTRAWQIWLLGLTVLIASVLVWQDEVSRPRYQSVSLHWLLDPINAAAVTKMQGKRIITRGDAGPTYDWLLNSRIPGAYPIFEHYKIDHPWSMAALYVVAPASNPPVSDHDPVTVFGVLHVSQGTAQTGQILSLCTEPKPPWPLFAEIIPEVVCAILGWLVTLAILRATGSSLIAAPERFRPGRCSFCGYDLRATPNRCPECDCRAS